MLAQWSTNNSANLIPAALTFVNLAPRRIDYRIGVALAGVVGTLCFPWEILNNLFTFLGYCGAFLLSIGGIMVADYYVLRGRRVNVPALYDPQGQYRYAGGFNPAGLVAWIVAGAAAAWWSDYSVFVGFPLGALLYLALMKLVVLPRHPQPEMAAAEGYLATSEGGELGLSRRRPVHPPAPRRDGGRGRPARGSVTRAGGGSPHPSPRDHRHEEPRADKEQEAAEAAR